MKLKQNTIKKPQNSNYYCNKRKFSFVQNCNLVPRAFWGILRNLDSAACQIFRKKNCKRRGDVVGRILYYLQSKKGVFRYDFWRYKTPSKM